MFCCFNSVRRERALDMAVGGDGLTADAEFIAAFDSGNAPAVAQAIRDRCPDTAIVVAADNDIKQERNPRILKNPGLEKATETATPSQEARSSKEFPASRRRYPFGVGTLHSKIPSQLNPV